MRPRGFICEHMGMNGLQSIASVRTSCLLLGIQNKMEFGFTRAPLSTELGTHGSRSTRAKAVAATFSEIFNAQLLSSEHIPGGGAGLLAKTLELSFALFQSAMCPLTFTWTETTAGL